MNVKMSRKTLGAAVIAVVAAFTVSLPAYSAPTTGFEARGDVVPAFSFNYYDRFFWGGITSWVTVSGDGDTLLGVEVYDQNGFLIVTNSGWGTFSTCFTPRWTGPFRVIVRNFGGVWNQYRITFS